MTPAKKEYDTNQARAFEKLGKDAWKAQNKTSNWNIVKATATQNMFLKYPW